MGKFPLCLKHLLSQVALKAHWANMMIIYVTLCQYYFLITNSQSMPGMVWSWVRWHPLLTGNWNALGGGIRQSHFHHQRNTVSSIMVDMEFTIYFMAFIMQVTAQVQLAVRRLLMTDTIHDGLMVILILATSCMWDCTSSSSTFRQYLPSFFHPQTGIIHIQIDGGGNGA